MNVDAPCQRRGTSAWVAVAGVCLLSGCGGPQSTLDPQGPVAEAIAHTWWVMSAGALLILALVMALVFYGMFRDPAKRLALAAVPFLVWMGVVFPLVVLTALLIYGTDVGRRITKSADDPLRIEVTGHRWWWEVRYPAGAGPEVTTANELRLPVAVPIELTLKSADVIHSFWIPNLGGKVDMIPGLTNTLRFTAAAPGRFHVQCAEFCGAQHARMGLVAVAEAAADFQRWREARAAVAAASPQPGLDRFMALGCAGCHAIAGTPAAGTGGPVLTHLAGRPTLGGSAARYSPEALRTWLADHGHALKPGSKSPDPRVLAPADAETLARFLEQLQ